MMRWKEDFVGNTQRKCVHIHNNGDFDNGKVLYMEPDWDLLDFLNAASQRLNMVPSAKRLFNVDGVVVDDCMMIEDNDILFLSMHEDFIHPNYSGVNSVSEQPRSNRGEGEKLPISVSGFKVGDMLGKGGFGEVRMGEHQLTGEKVALKFLRKADIHSLGAAERTNTEIQCLTALRHNNIIRLQQHTESVNHIVLVFELMQGGDLMKYLIANKERRGLAQASLTEDECKHVFYQVLSGVSFAHNQHICHRDLKLENILLKDHTLNLVKIADFGLSDFYRPGSTMKSNCGTLSFLSPEVFKGTSNAGPPLDVWALGVILFAMLCGRLPFEGNDFIGTKRPRESVIKSRIIKGQYKLDEHLGPEAKDLIRRMLQVDPSERASLPEIFNHVWVRSASVSHYSDSFLANGGGSAKLHTALSSSDLSSMIEQTPISPMKVHRKQLSMTNLEKALLEKSPSDNSLFSSPVPPYAGSSAALRSPRSKDSTPVGSYQSNSRLLMAHSPADIIPVAQPPEECQSPQSVRSDHMFSFATTNDSDSGKSLETPGIAASGSKEVSGGSATVLSTFKLVPLRRNNSSHKETDLEYSPRGLTSTPPMLNSDRRSNSDSSQGSVSGTTRPNTALLSRIGPGSSAVAALNGIDDEIFILNSGTVSENNRKSYPRKENTGKSLFNGIAEQKPKRHSETSAAASPSLHVRRDSDSKRLSNNALSIFDSVTSSPDDRYRGRSASGSVQPPAMGANGGRVRFN